MYSKFVGALLVAVLTVFASVASSSYWDIKGGDVPFPWGTEIPVPLENIGGQWIAEPDEPEEGKPVHFNIIVESEDETPVVTVYETKAETGEILAEGRGFESPAEKAIRAIMRRADGSSYFVKLRSFVDKNENTVNVLTIVNLTADQRRPVDYVLKKEARNSSER